MPTNKYPYAESAYSTEIMRETLSSGERVYVARHPELGGCMAHGATVEEAKSNLSEAFEISMDHLIKHSLPIPKPDMFAWQNVATSSQTTVIGSPKDTNEVYVRLATIRIGEPSPITPVLDTGNPLLTPK